MCFGPGPHFCWLSVKFLETVSSPRPSNFREISGKFVTFFSPSADGPSAIWSRTGRNGREKFRIQSEHSDFWYEPRPCPEHGLDKCFVMISGGPDDASDSPGGHLRGILTPAEERALDFFVRGVKFPWKFPESCFHPRGQISKGISRNLGQGQLRTQSGSPSNPHKTGMNGSRASCSMLLATLNSEAPLPAAAPAAAGVAAADVTMTGTAPAAAGDQV